MDKQNVAYIYKGNYFLIKEWSTGTSHNMDDPWKHYKWKKPVKKGPHMIGFNLYEISKIGKSIEIESRLVIDYRWI